ncbi:uncharacterized protein DFL_000143 [Arthrobotrys flagrans]|uniref:Uncharacterized protein n=1 Tax=Arthrobotrys flagrans TaxID=97331 RepID=A0A437AD22_ARTFL|nr:hypothetical protein DFL_000143 [Arthrobotrys flagrans]
MAPPVIITFLGTSSAVPSLTRNHSSLSVTLPSGNTYLFDAGEATQHQLQKVAGGFKLSSLKRIFITHMHGDHMFGIVPLLCTLLNGAGGTVGVEDPRVVATVEKRGKEAGFEIYGPEGLREYIRTSLRLTRSLLGGSYVVHELHFPTNGVEECAKVKGSAENMMPMELPGYNVFPDKAGYWKDILSSTESSQPREWEVSAGPILHSVPCLGYVLTEPPLPGKITPDYREKIMANKEALVKSGIKNPMSLLSKVTALGEGEFIDLPDGDRLASPPVRRGRKITVLGDTYDASPIKNLANGSDVLIHEATNAFLGNKLGKESKEYKEGETYEDVRRKTIEHGHSTPEMAAAFAISIGLGNTGGALGRVITEQNGKGGKSKEVEKPRGVLLLNHFSSRYADPRSSDAAAATMEAIRESAVEAVQIVKDTQPEGSIDVVCCYDLMQFEVRAGD